MTYSPFTFVFIVISTLSFCVATPAQRKADHVTVVIQTELGSIEAEIDTLRSPMTAKNFLRYVDAGHYDGGRFHRTVRMANQPSSKVKIEVVQAGVDPNKEKVGFAPIKLERTNQTGLHHENGTLSMARDGPDTATSDFFICIGPQPSLDYEGKRNPDGQGFAAFGRVVKGMDIVRMVQASNAEEQKLTPPIKILKIRQKS
jgi:peptidyl-prolyl cis-trans isomerase A (cyclophilin A)